MLAMDRRQVEGYRLASQKAIRETKDGWLVKSQSGSGFYRVSDTFMCECPDSELHNNTCKHAYAVRYYLDIEKDKPQGKETEKIKLTYKQAWSAYNEAQTSEGKMFDELLRDLAYDVKDPIRPLIGRPRLLLRDQVFVAIKKIYSQMSERRAVSLFGIAKEKGHITHTPHFNTVHQFLNNPKTTTILEELVAITSAPLRGIETEFAIDSTGFRTRNFGAYCEDRYPSRREHVWIKLHASCGVKTNIIVSVRILEDEHSADSPQFIPLTQEIAKNGFKVDKVFADKAYNSVANYNAVDQLGGKAYIPFKSNTTTWSSKGNNARLWRKMYYYFEMNREEFEINYHKRSNIESTFAAMKKKLGIS